MKDYFFGMRLKFFSVRSFRRISGCNIWREIQPKFLKKQKKFFPVKNVTITALDLAILKKHLQSIKHNTTKLQPKILNICSCGKTFTHRGSLYNHKRSCKKSTNDILQDDGNENYKALFHKAMEQMQQQQNELIDEF